MFYHILEKYVADPRIGMPLAIDVDIPGDRHLFLFESIEQWYVVIETDYLGLNTLHTVDLVEWLFPVSAQGWCVIREFQKTLDKDMVPVDWFSSADDIEVAKRSYDHVMFEEHGRKYALLKVVPNKGVSERSFDLEFYAGSEETADEDASQMHTTAV